MNGKTVSDAMCADMVMIDDRTLEPVATKVGVGLLTFWSIVHLDLPY